MVVQAMMVAVVQEGRHFPRWGAERATVPVEAVASVVVAAVAPAEEEVVVVTAAAAEAARPAGAVAAVPSTLGQIRSLLLA